MSDAAASAGREPAERAAGTALADSVPFVVLLGALTMLPPLSIDIMLPGLPVIGHALHASSAAMYQSLSLFMLAFGAGQLVLGPFSDRYGRRPVLVCGTAVFTLGGLACTFAPNVTILLIGRFVQGLGACAGALNARAIVQDVSPTRERAAALQAYVGSVTSFAPMLAPLLGAFILAALGWRWMYGVLVVAGVLLLAAVQWRLPETAPRTGEPVLPRYLRVLRLPRTVPLAVLITAQFGAYFALISGSPFALVAQMHVGTAPYAAAFAINACALLAGSIVTARLARRVGTSRLFAVGVVLSLLAAALACFVDVFAPSPIAFVATFASYAFSVGIVLPNAFAAALGDARGDAGIASGILGAVQMLGAAMGSTLAAAIPLQPSAGIGVTVLMLTAVAASAYGVARRASSAATPAP